MRDSAALKAVEALLAKGVKEIRAYDPLAMDAAQDYWFNPKDNYLFERITYHDSASEALKAQMHATSLPTGKNSAGWRQQSKMRQIPPVRFHISLSTADA